jgi:hypothetical protein
MNYIKHFSVLLICVHYTSIKTTQLNQQEDIFDFLCTRNGSKEDYNNDIISNLIGILAHGYVALSEKSSERSRQEAVLNAVQSAQTLVNAVVDHRNSYRSIQTYDSYEISEKITLALQQIIKSENFRNQLCKLIEETT